jgi:IS605 OrfB family transposase
MAHPAGTLILMKRSIAIRLDATNLQTEKLAVLQSMFAAACNVVVPIALAHRCTNRFKLHHLAYYTVRERFPALGAQMACNAIKRVARSLKTHRANGQAWATIAFRANASVHFDARTFRMREHYVSLFTMEGRQQVTMRLGSFQRDRLKQGAVKEAELLVRRGVWYLHVALDVPESDALTGSGILGVDLGENVTAATSGGTLYGGGAVRNTRDRFLAFRGRLQCNGSQSARQLLGRVSGRESRHVRHVNHQISAHIVAEATSTGCGTIILENLTNIRSRIKMGKRMRTRLHRWSWRQLQTFIEYKAAAAGIGVWYVDPAYTSQTCSVCGGIGRRTRHRFSCTTCGIFAHSDRNAARNLAKIGARALAPTGEVMRPHVAA